MQEARQRYEETSSLDAQGDQLVDRTIGVGRSRGNAVRRGLGLGGSPPGTG